MSELEKYRSDHLFLLIGTNPLPNYVAAKLLAKSEGHVYLVCTKETGPVADRLVATVPLTERHWSKICVEEAEPKNIFEQVSYYAQGKEGVGLNYTGGTKAMAVHAYRAVMNTNKESICSYLGADLRLRIEQPNIPSFLTPYVGLSIQLDLKTLLALHGYTLKHDISRSPFQPDLCRELVRIPCSELRRWCNGNLRSSPGTEMKKKAELKSVSLPVNPPFFDRLIPYWQGSSTLSELAQRWKYDPEETAKWLDGLWLESYTFWAIQQVAASCHIHDAGLNIEPKERDFEFDVAAMRGYQLFAISCTTETRRSLAKQKLFEVFVRARQMGGDEARVGLVCCAPKDNPDSNPAAIQKEIEESWDAAGKVRVFGAEHLPNLPAHLQDWFNSQPS